VSPTPLAFRNVSFWASRRGREPKRPSRTRGEAHLCIFFPAATIPDRNFTPTLELTPKCHALILEYTRDELEVLAPGNREQGFNRISEPFCLKEGMVFCVEPSVKFDGGQALKVEETVLIKKEENVILSVL
jgi:hypothetical protein